MASGSLRATLATNIKRLISHDQRGARYSVRAWAQGKGLEMRLVDRITKGEHAIGLDTLQDLADACGLPAWQLLLEDFEPGKPADVRITAEDKLLIDRLRGLLDVLIPSNSGLAFRLLSTAGCSWTQMPDIAGQLLGIFA